MRKRRRRGAPPAAGAGAETSAGERSEPARGAAEAPAAESQWRGRPGRRTTEDRTQAVLALLAGKASVDQVAARYGVQPATVEGWRQAALEGIEQVLRRGSAKPAEVLELERELETLKAAFTRMAMKNELIERALRDRPSPPARSPR